MKIHKIICDRMLITLSNLDSSQVRITDLRHEQRTFNILDYLGSGYFAGCVGGFCGAYAGQPADTIKTRIQLIGQQYWVDFLKIILI